MDKDLDYKNRQEAYRIAMLANQPTLRDQFAMSALTGAISDSELFSTIENGEVAKLCYEIADAMLKERDADQSGK